MEARIVRIPLVSPMKLGGVEISTADNLIVRIADTDGAVGWGEAASAPAMTGETPEGMLAAARYLAPWLEGREIEDFGALHRMLDRFLYGNHGVKAAIEVALLDIQGKRGRKPLWDLLGGRARQEAVVLTMVAGGNPASEIDDAKRQRDAGFRAFKVKVGGAEPERDLERAAAVRAVAGAKARVSADANQGYSRSEALGFAEGAAQARLDFMEQLVASSDLEGMAACAAATSVPLGADEGFHSLDDIRRHRDAGAAAGGSLKTIKLGGALGVVEAARVMQDLDMHVNLAGKLAETGISSAAIAHLAVALPQLDWDVSVTNQYLVDDIVRDPITIRDGVVRPPERPGLGIVLDETKLSGFTSMK